MKYQIYLKKEASAFINKLAEQSKTKPATVIKKLVESFVLMTKPVEGQILNEVSIHGKDNTSKR